MPNALQQETTTQEQLNDYENHISQWFNKRYRRNDDVRTFTFESEVWLLKKAYHNNDRNRIDFNFFSKVVYNKKDKILFKCFLANMLLDGYSETTVTDYYYILKQFYIATHGLSLINKFSDDEVKYYCSHNDEVCLNIPLKYIDFVIENSFYGDNY